MDALIRHLQQGEELSARDIGAAAELLLDPKVADREKEALLEALARKGETPAEIGGFVEVFLEQGGCWGGRRAGEGS